MSDKDKRMAEELHWLRRMLDSVGSQEGIAGFEFRQLQTSRWVVIDLDGALLREVEASSLPEAVRAAGMETPTKYPPSDASGSTEVDGVLFYPPSRRLEAMVFLFYHFLEEEPRPRAKRQKDVVRFEDLHIDARNAFREIGCDPQLFEFRSDGVEASAYSFGNGALYVWEPNANNSFDWFFYGVDSVGRAR